jgi:hypothetical protein
LQRARRRNNGEGKKMYSNNQTQARMYLVTLLRVLMVGDPKTVKEEAESMALDFVDLVIAAAVEKAEKNLIDKIHLGEIKL